MWILNFIPDDWLLALVNITALISVVVLLVSWMFGNIPIIGKYATVAKIAATVILAFSIYFKGSLDTELTWRARVAELEAKVKLAEEKSAEVNTVIQDRIVTKTKLVRDTQVVVQEKIREVEKLINEKCVLDPAVIEIHNRAATINGDQP